ncbi:MFS general substrate transporter [Coniochaeta ligniaria NRRL 30616]|uniref:MFS general substrate transporter n=1 Tax=Coniochaeta ligniaria NRRL 30616 TaxID=1408157 RepID=A0A1J7IWS5_9PEZI|nr:MFS general substrate transporter [Coniochaeta ligniaria NRRL 30616]
MHADESARKSDGSSPSVTDEKAGREREGSSSGRTENDSQDHDDLSEKLDVKRDPSIASFQTSSSHDDERISIVASRPSRPASRISRTVSEVYHDIETRRDVEIPEPDTEKLPAEPSDPNLVTWTTPYDPENPKTWTMRKKWAAVIIVSFFTLISPVSSTMIAPAMTAIGRDLDIPSQFDQALTLSIFLLAYSVGPLFLGPLSELYGRVPVLQLFNLLYLFFNLGCGLAQSKAQMITFRFFAGLGGSVSLAVGGGVLGDLFTAEQRGRAMSIYSLMPLMGPAIGPIAGAFVTARTTWRWVFHATTMADAVIQVAGLFYLRETYAPVLLKRRRARLVKETGNAALHTRYDTDQTVAQALGTALVRPFRLLGTQVIVQMLALYLMFLYGQLYLQLSTFPKLWEQHYHESVEIAGLNYISLGLGLWLGSQLCAPLQDRIYAWLKRREGVTVGRPEFRVPMMVPGAVMMPVGLLIYGWSAQYHVHWIVPNIGVLIMAAGTIVCFQCIQGYLVDSYTLYAASAVGAGTVLRSLAGFGFPLFGPYMYDRLDYGWGNTLLALISIVIGWPAPILLWKYGEKLRAKSPFAAGE